MKRIFTIATIFCLLWVVGVAVAEYRGSSETMIVPAANNTMTDTRLRRDVMPDAYTIWSKDGGAFRIKRYLGGVLEPQWMVIPAQTSITVPSVQPYDSSGSWINKIMVADHGDTVYFLPWYN